jgi:transcriptional regulator BetI-like protein
MGPAGDRGHGRYRLIHVIRCVVEVEAQAAARGRIQPERVMGECRAGPSDPGWILWMEAWARAPHNRQVTEFMEKLLAPWRDDLAAIIARGVAEAAFAAPASLDDFTLRFNALLDGLALLRLRRLHQPSRKRLVELALTTARAELTPDAPAAPAG